MRLPQTNARAALLLLALLSIFGGAGQIATAQSAGAPAASFKQVVLLCATEPESARFEAAWLSWLEANPDADSDQVIRQVLSKAGTLRSMGLAGVEPAATRRRLSDPGIAARMRDLARFGAPEPQVRARSSQASQPAPG